MQHHDGWRTWAIGLAFAVGSMLVPSISNALLVGISPLATSPTFIATHGLVLAAIGAIPDRTLPTDVAAGSGKADREAWLLIVRVAVGSVVSVYGSLFALNAIGLGRLAGLTAGATLLFGLRELRSGWGSRWVLIQCVSRVVSGLGICLITHPWQSDPTQLTGALLALVSAACTLNFTACMNRLTKKRMAQAGSAKASVLALPVLVAVAFWFEGTNWLTTPSVIVKSTIAGALAGLTTSMVIATIKRFTPAAQGVVFTLRTPISATVGAVGVALGLLPVAQRPTWTAAAGICVVFLAALVAARNGEAPGRYQLNR
ncbi:hypothetical protein ACQPZP_34350 [Spirillospora sp. CA-142024]|uniref:hypothetical protein n=1 Tax=Spirillospora sp. CA-142024 TaxID=3240036 RepID=UPI003D949804